MTPSPISYDEWIDTFETFSYSGHRIAYRQMGEGPALLLLHGFPTCSWDWSWITPALSDHFSLIIPDLMDAGRSHNPYGKTVSIMTQVDMISTLIDRIGIPAIHILPHDVGDTVAQEILARQQEKRLGFRALSVTYLNGGLLPEFHRPTDGQKLLAGPLGWFAARFASKDRMMDGFASVFGEKTRPSREQKTLFWRTIQGINGRGSIRRRINYMKERRDQQHRWVGAMKGATIPQFMINGTADPVSGKHAVDGLSRRIPAVEITRIPSIGHYPQIEAPDAVVAAFINWHRTLGTL